MDYVKKYLSLDARASDAETKVEQYRERVERDRWEQCQIAWEAIDSGEFTQSNFAQAVGISRTTIRNQAIAWSEWSECASTDRPTYGEAVALASGSTSAEGWARKDKSAAVKALNDPELAAQLPAAAIVAAVRANPDAVRALARNTDVREAIEDEGIKVRANQPMTAEEQEAMEKRARKAAHGVAEALDIDEAVEYLRGSAREIANAVIAAEEFGITDEKGEAEALSSIKRWLRVYEGKAEWTEADAESAREMGVKIPD